MYGLDRTALVRIAVNAIVSLSLAVLVNLFTENPGLALAALAGSVLVLQVIGQFLSEYLNLKDVESQKTALANALKSLVPFSSRSRTRAEALRIAREGVDARRQVRLRPMVPAPIIDQVVRWMSEHGDPVVEVPSGSVRVLVAPMGAGKTEQAARWLEAGIRESEADPTSEVPLWLEARRVASGLEAAIHNHLGRDPDRRCRVVIDDLDSVDQNEARHLLKEARQLTHIWPRLTVLATSRPDIILDDGERLSVEPWSIAQGVELARLALGKDLPYEVWRTETQALLTSPLLALAMARRIRAGGSTPTSPLKLLSNITGDILRTEHPDQASPEVWAELAKLACRILDAHGPVSSDSYGNEAEVWQLTKTDFVVEDNGLLKFALPVFEQHFAAHALKDGTAQIENAAGPRTFPRWRYAIAFAVAASGPDIAERVLREVARTNAAAASWVIDELRRDLNGSTGEVIVGPDMISVDGRSIFRSNAESRSITAGGWLREAHSCMLEGLGPLARHLAKYRHSNLTQWGFSLGQTEAIRAVSYDAAPDPPIVEVPERFKEVGDDPRWGYIEGFQFPAYPLGRWYWAQKKVQDSLEDVIQRRTLPTRPGGLLDRERLWSMAKFVARLAQRIDPTDVDALRARVAKMMVTVEESTRATWSAGGNYTADSDDIRWISSRIESDDDLPRQAPWPAPDVRSPSHRWYWQSYSPELTRRVTEDVVLAALEGYRELVELNFPNLGEALGLYSIFPVRFDGVLYRYEDDGDYTLWLEYRLSKNHAVHDGRPSVHLSVSTYKASPIEQEFQQRADPVHDSAFFNIAQQGKRWNIGGERPATDLAYEWLVRDLKVVGLLPRSFHFY